MARIPLLITLRQVKAGFSFISTKEKVNNLLFMNDLKLYGKDEIELERLVECFNQYSNNIGIRFGLDRSGVVFIENRLKKKCKGINLPDGERIKK